MLSIVFWGFSRSADNTVRMFDRRNLTSGPINIFEGHSEAVNCVQACVYVPESFEYEF